MLVVLSIAILTFFDGDEFVSPVLEQKQTESNFFGWLSTIDLGQLCCLLKERRLLIISAIRLSNSFDSYALDIVVIKKIGGLVS